ncbi:MAG: hypothetical protein RJA70_3277, partial [Pseudomonadota bacterium]
MLLAFVATIAQNTDGLAQSQPETGTPVGPNPPTAEATPAASTLRLRVVRSTLANGLRVVLNPDPLSSSVAVAVTYNVGSKDEEFGQSGFAHLFEHMMFQGSRNVEKGAHSNWIAARGGRSNATTSKDRTTFFEVLPAGELELALWLEADRMDDLAVNRENFENQRAIATEEYRTKYSGSVYAPGYVRLQQLVFQGYWPYEHPTIGLLQDLDAARYSWVRPFHEVYYAPNNAVLSVSGNFDIERASALIDKHFGRLRPNPDSHEFQRLERLPRQNSERLSVLVDVNAQSPGVYYGYRISARGTRTHRALELATRVLAGGDSSRLHQSLVIEKAAATSVAAWTAGNNDPDALVIRLILSPLSTVDTAQHWLDGELKRLRLISPSDAELSRAKHRMRLQLLRELETTQGRAVRLGDHEISFGDATLLEGELRAYDDITNADVREAASQFLQDTRRSIVEIYPPGWARDIGPVEVTKTHVVRAGETLIRIAAQYGTTAEVLAKQNGISLKKPIVPGQRLLATLGAGAKSPLRTHKVTAGESLIGIAKRYSITASDLAEMNNLSTKKPIYPGQDLIVPKVPSKLKSDTIAPEPATLKKVIKTYTVKKGDNLIRIAHRFGV